MTSFTFHQSLVLKLVFLNACGLNMSLMVTWLCWSLCVLHVHVSWFWPSFMAPLLSPGEAQVGVYKVLSEVHVCLINGYKPFDALKKWKKMKMFCHYSWSPLQEQVSSRWISSIKSHWYKSLGLLHWLSWLGRGLIMCVEINEGDTILLYTMKLVLQKKI